MLTSRKAKAYRARRHRRMKNPEYRAKYLKKQRARHRTDEHRAYRRAYYKKNKAMWDAYARVYRQRPEVKAKKKARRAARYAKMGT